MWPKRSFCISCLSCSLYRVPLPKEGGPPLEKRESMTENEALSDPGPVCLGAA